MTNTFTHNAFKQVQPILNAIHEHPFNIQLANGTLNKDAFAYYMQQDSLYLVEYAKAFALLAGKAVHEKDITLLLNLASEALVAERELHSQYFKKFVINASNKKEPACFYYTTFLLERASLADLAVGVAALLPCLWVYHEVGLSILKKSTNNNPYSLWIETYSCEHFAKVVAESIELTDRLAENASNEVREQMLEAFLQSSRLEFCFWDDAYNQRRWQI